MHIKCLNYAHTRLWQSGVSAGHVSSVQLWFAEGVPSAEVDCAIPYRLGNRLIVMARRVFAQLKFISTVF
jgi:hypothetical protein